MRLPNYSVKTVLLENCVSCTVFPVIFQGFPVNPSTSLENICSIDRKQKKGGGKVEKKGLGQNIQCNLHPVMRISKKN